MKPAFELNLERIVEASRDRVWRAWTIPDEVSQWFAPKPFILEIYKMEFRAGGTFQMAMRAPDGAKHEFGGTYLEVIPNEKIVWIGEFPGDPKNNMRTEVVFEDMGGKTRIKVRQTIAILTPLNKPATEGARQGWTMTLDQLAAFVRGPLR